MSTRLRTLVTLCALVMAAGCLRKQEAPSVPQVVTEEHFLVHVVSARGETLSRIAKWYTGSPESWKAIAALNSSVETRSLQNGDRILIPASLVKTTEPLARVVEKSRTKGKTRRVGPKAPETLPADEEQPVPVHAEEAPLAPADVEPAAVVENPAPPAELQVSADSGVTSEPSGSQPDSAVLVEPAKVSIQPESSTVKSVEDMIREEQQQVERLRQELGGAGTNPQTN